MPNVAHHAVHRWPDGVESFTTFPTHEHAQEQANSINDRFNHMVGHEVYIMCSDNHAVENLELPESVIP